MNESADELERLALLVHEVRSPTAALSAIAAAMADGDMDEESRRELLRLAVDACRGIERIVRDAALGALLVENVDVGAIARAAVSGAVLAGGQVRLDAERGPLVVRGDAVRLRQAIDNLVTNADAYSTAGEETVVTVARRGSEIAVSVRDRGPGIDIGDQERIFLPGVRLDISRPGSGLGLTVVRAIAEAHGGTVTVDSAPGLGAGATFTLTLPAVSPS